MIDWTPSAVAIQLGPLPLYWYGVAYAVGLAVAYWVMARQARRFGQNPDDHRQRPDHHRGRRADRRPAVPRDRPVAAVRERPPEDHPAAVQRPRRLRRGRHRRDRRIVYLAGASASPFWRWADIVAPGIFVMQAVGRWGNFFNQELYGPPTNAAVGHRRSTAPTASSSTRARRSRSTTTHFHPLFLYESLSGLLGRARPDLALEAAATRLRVGDLAADHAHLDRRRAVPPRVPADRQLAPRGHPDRPDLRRGVRRDRHRRSSWPPAPARAPPHRCSTRPRSPRPASRATSADDDATTSTRPTTMRGSTRSSA